MPRHISSFWGQNFVSLASACRVMRGVMADKNVLGDGRYICRYREREIQPSPPQCATRPLFSDFAVREILFMFSCVTLKWPVIHTMYNLWSCSPDPFIFLLSRASFGSRWLVLAAACSVRASSVFERNRSGFRSCDVLAGLEVGGAGGNKCRSNERSGIKRRRYWRLGGSDRADASHFFQPQQQQAGGGGR